MNEQRLKVGAVGSQFYLPILDSAGKVIDCSTVENATLVMVLNGTTREATCQLIEPLTSELPWVAVYKTVVGDLHSEGALFFEVWVKFENGDNIPTATAQEYVCPKLRKDDE